MPSLLIIFPFKIISSTLLKSFISSNGLPFTTITSADCLDILQETGTLEPGKSADVIVVKGNPLDDIKLLNNVEDIILKGKIIKRDGKLLI